MKIIKNIKVKLQIYLLISTTKICKLDYHRGPSIILHSIDLILVKVDSINWYEYIDYFWDQSSFVLT